MTTCLRTMWLNIHQSETAMNNIYSKLSYGTFNLLFQLQAFYSPVWDMTLCSFILQVHLLLLASK